MLCLSDVSDSCHLTWRNEARSSLQIRTSANFHRETVEYSLSQAQLKSFDGWKRPDDIFPGGPQISSPTSSDLVQDAVTDCSVIASLCALAERMQDDSSLAKHLPLRGIIYPYNETSGHPTIAASGKYIFRLTFNGCQRKVVIDDRLPSSRTNRKLHVIDRNCPSLMWPALLEKAYLKVRGGYDFPGSNPGTDLSVMTGWIPEQILLRQYVQRELIRSERSL